MIRVFSYLCKKSKNIIIIQNFDYQTPTRLIFGKGVIAKLPSVMAHHIAVNEGLENAYAPLTEKDIAEIITASL